MFFKTIVNVILFLWMLSLNQKIKVKIMHMG